MNNSFGRLIDGMCATLRQEVLTRLTDDFARGQVFGVINLLNTFKVRADWSAGFLLDQIAAQQRALDGVRALVGAAPAPGHAPAVPASPPLPALPVSADLCAAPLPAATPVADLLARRDAGNAAIGAVLAWLDAEGRALPAETRAAVESRLREAMDAEVQLELKNSPRPLFAEMSSGREG